MTVYTCRDCGHQYGATMPSAPVIALHRACSHSGGVPIVAVPYAHTGFGAGAL